LLDCYEDILGHDFIKMIVDILLIYIYYDRAVVKYQIEGHNL